MSRFYWVALVIVLAVVVIAIVWSLGTLLFVDVPSLVVVVVPVLAMSIASFSPREIGKSFRVAFARQPAEPAELRTAAAFFRALQRYLILSGLIGVFTGVISLLGWIGQKPSLSTNVASGFALLLISAFYAIVLLLTVAVPFRSAVDKRLAEAS